MPAASMCPKLLPTNMLRTSPMEKNLVRNLARAKFRASVVEGRRNVDLGQRVVFAG
jgi:hypothetical protein